MIEIKPATPDDILTFPEIENDAGTLFSAHGFLHMKDFPCTPASYYLSRPEGSLFLVAKEGPTAVGFAVGLVKDGQAYLRELGVRRAFARQGIGTRLVKGVIAWAEESGFHALTLTTFRDFPFNAPFYQKLGFEIFEPDDKAWPSLRKTRKEERQSGLEKNHPRVAMIRKIS